MKRREWSRRTDARRRDVKTERQREYYHSPTGGWLVARRRTLERQRERIRTQLAELDKEATVC